MPQAKQCKNKAALAFIDTEKYSLTRLIQIGHAGALLLHLLSGIFMNRDNKVFATLCLLVKAITYIIVQFVV